MFYENKRHYVERSPVSWAESVFVCIGDDSNAARPNAVLNEQRESFYVHGDLLTKVDAHANRHSARLPTVASVARAARARVGVRDAGDEIATLLRKCGSLEEVYTAASEYLSEGVATLHTKYDKLNPGQQRMVLGNRMRAKWKKENP